jgi:hypothetical protein
MAAETASMMAVDCHKDGSDDGLSLGFELGIMTAPGGGGSGEMAETGLREDAMMDPPALMMGSYRSWSG